MQDKASEAVGPAEHDPFLNPADAFVPDIYDPAAAPRRIPKLALIDRLHAAGLFDAALAVIKADPLQYERWQASSSVDPENPEVRGLIEAIGGDAEALLAAV